MERLAALLVFVLAPSVVAQEASPETVEAPERVTVDAEALRSALTAEAERQGLVGAAAAVVWDGEITEVYFGHADREGGVPVDATTLFRWASISKPVTAVAALQLVRAEKLDLDRDVRSYVKEFPEKPWPITARQLLCHRGGIVHYRNGKVIRSDVDYDDEHPFADVVTALDTFKESPLVAEPGTKYSYTTHGYILLGAVVQRAGGAPFHEQVAARISKPLGMDTFRPDFQWEAIPGRAVGYRRARKETVRSSNTDVSWKLPGGGFLSSVGDLARFARGLMGEEVLTAEDKALMWVQQDAPELPGGKQPYGLGFGVRLVDGAWRIAHSGSQEKTRTMMQLDPERGLAVVVMTNSEWANVAMLASAIRKQAP